VIGTGARTRVLVALFRNPQAIAINLRSRGRPPAYPASVGALRFDDARRPIDPANNAQTDGASTHDNAIDG
jgi:hypothetical protein